MRTRIDYYQIQACLKIKQIDIKTFNFMPNDFPFSRTK